MRKEFMTVYLRAVERGQEVGRHADGGGLIGAVEDCAGAVENIDVAHGDVHAKIRLGHQQFFHPAGSGGGGALELADEVGGKGLGHLVVELADIEVANAVD